MNQSFKSLYCKEFKSYFYSPMGYLFLILFIFASGQLAFEPGKGSFFLARQADLMSFFRYLPWLMIILCPAVTMKLWAEERKSGSVELLFTAPITLTQAVVAKFLSAWSFIVLAIILTFPMVITVYYLGTPDFMVIVSGYLASILTAGVGVAVGSFFSAVSKNQVMSFILALVFSYLLIMFASPAVLQFLGDLTPAYVVSVLESASLLEHFEMLSKGVIGFKSLWFYALFILGPLTATVYYLEETRS